MKRFILLTTFIIITSSAIAQKPESLLGICPVSSLELEPYASWYKPNYQNYIPQPEVIAQIKKLSLEKFTMRIVFGSWCGDSKRELPRMIKVLQAVGFPEKNLELIGVYDSLQVYKQAPKREEKGLNIYRVPTFIVYQKGKELGRIVEFAVESMERDLLKILSGQSYTHNYKSYTQVNEWLAQGVLADANVNPRGMAEQIRADVSRESDLNTCGYVLLMRGDVKEAVTILRINVNLFPQSSNCFDSLGEAYVMAGSPENAKSCYERAIELDPKNENARSQLSKLKEAK